MPTISESQELGVGSTEKNDKETAHLSERLDASIRDFLTPLMEHKDVIDRIMRLLIPNSTNICEYATGDTIGLPHLHEQLKYWVSDKKLKAETTYFSTQNPEALDLARIVTLRSEDNRGFAEYSLSIMRVNKAFHKLGLKYMWGRNFRFQCSARGAKDFLLKNALLARSITQVDMFYHFEGEAGVIETKDHDWHDMLSTMRHDLSFIPKIHVHVGHGFWSKTNWRWGPNGVINDSVFRDDGRYLPLVMYDVARFAVPAERWKDHKDPATLCTAGTLVRVSIEDEKMTGEETWKVNEKIRRVEFVEQLNDEVLRQGLARPLHPGGRSRTSYTRPYVPR
jgi:hypothetical protein